MFRNQKRIRSMSESQKTDSDMQYGNLTLLPEMLKQELPSVDKARSTTKETQEMPVIIQRRNTLHQSLGLTEIDMLYNQGDYVSHQHVLFATGKIHPSKSETCLLSTEDGLKRQVIY